MVLEALDRVNRELGTLTALITHNAGIAAMAHRVIRMMDGQIAEQRTVHDRLAPADISW